jgi:hypothetical protein
MVVRARIRRCTCIREVLFLICFTGLAYNIYAKIHMLMKIQLNQIVENFIRILKHCKMTNCVIFFALKCQFTAWGRFEFQPGRC